MRLRVRLVPVQRDAKGVDARRHQLEAEGPVGARSAGPPRDLEPRAGQAHARRSRSSPHPTTVPVAPPRGPAPAPATESVWSKTVTRIVSTPSAAGAIHETCDIVGSRWMNRPALAVQRKVNDIRVGIVDRAGDDRGVRQGQGVRVRGERRLRRRVHELGERLVTAAAGQDHHDEAQRPQRIVSWAWAPPGGFYGRQRRRKDRDRRRRAPAEPAGAGSGPKVAGSSVLDAPGIFRLESRLHERTNPQLAPARDRPPAPPHLGARHPGGLATAAVGIPAAPGDGDLRHRPGPRAHPAARLGHDLHHAPHPGAGPRPGALGLPRVWGPGRVAAAGRGLPHRQPGPGEPGPGAGVAAILLRGRRPRGLPGGLDPGAGRSRGRAARLAGAGVQRHLGGAPRPFALPALFHLHHADGVRAHPHRAVAFRHRQPGDARPPELAGHLPDRIRDPPRRSSFSWRRCFSRASRSPWCTRSCPTCG